MRLILTILITGSSPGHSYLIARFGAQSSAEIAMWPAPSNRNVSYPMRASQGYKNTVRKEELPWGGMGRGTTGRKSA